MKYLKMLLVFALITVVGSVNAQSGSKLNGKTYTYVMKDVSGEGDETIDKLTFTNNTVTSERLATKGFKGSNVAEKSTAGGSQFEVTFTSDKEGTMKFTGDVSGNNIQGTIVVINAIGKTTNMAFRGMISSEWDNIRKQKEDYQKGKNE